MIYNLLPPNQEAAPKKKLRGRGRYIRKILAIAETFPIDVSDASWYDRWHYHPDWHGYGNLSWRLRKAHLHAMTKAYGNFAKQLSGYKNQYQLYLYLDSSDSSQDAVFIHTPNPNGNSFPVKYDDVEWGIPNIAEYFEASLPNYRFRSGKMNWRGADVYFIYSPEFGVSIEA